MSANGHPEDLDLFEYVEGDLDGKRAPEVAAHVATCERCAKEVRLLEAGKAALRESALLELPPKRRAIVFRELPRRERGRGFSPKQLVAILTPVAAALAVVAVLVSRPSNGGESASPAAKTALASPAQAFEAGPQDSRAAATRVRAVRGPASEVAADLRRAGLQARVRSGRVEVTGATAAEVKYALLDRPGGVVGVYVR
jgi:anti-sigma factor RsiW